MATQQVVLSQSGFPIGQILPQRSYWAIKRSDRSWICEEDIVTDFLIGRRRIDWTLDLVSTGDWARIRELWLFCPPTPRNPGGNSVRLPITTPGTAFQLKVATFDTNIADGLRGLQAQIIGRVLNSGGECECFVYDYALQELIVNWRGNIGLGDHPGLGTWRPNIAGRPAITPIGRLSLDVVGIRLPTFEGPTTTVIVEEMKHEPLLLPEPVEKDCGCGEKRDKAGKDGGNGNQLS